MTDSQARHPETPHHAPEPTLNRWHRKSFRIDRGGGSPGADGSLMRSFQGFCTPAGGGPAAESKGVCPSPVTERRAEERVHQP